MLVACLLTSLLYPTVHCEIIFMPQNGINHKVTECIISILDKYFSEQKELTYVTMNLDGNQLLRAIHSNINILVISRQSTQQMFVPNQGYLITSLDVAHFTQYFQYLIREPMWNPYARFLIVISSIQDAELRMIFDELLKHHVINVLVVNATNDGQLYTYNPYDNYACGKYYEAVISFGVCPRPTNDILYPNKLITGLRKCTFTASLVHRPPFSLNPENMNHKKTLLGSEEYIITVLGDIEEFKVKFIYNYKSNQFSSVAPNMTAIGPMSMLQKNECDIVFGGLIMVTSRTKAFTYLCGYFDYADELKFAVRISSIIPTLKYIYLEFDFKVWIMLIVTFIIFSIVSMLFLQSKDRGEIVLRLLDSLFVHARAVHASMTVKCLLISWVWFAYLMNTFYQSSLVSLTTQPSREYQVSDEDDIVNYNFEPCFSTALRDYLKTETSKLGKFKYFREKGCESLPEAMETISTTDKMFTLVATYYYLYNQQKFMDKWGNPLTYYFKKPYTKFLFAYYFRKGFPVTKRLYLNALRMRESGLADKRMKDHYYIQRLKQKFSKRTFEPRFIFPWYIFVIGVALSTITFIVELLIKHVKWFQSKILDTT